VEPILTAWATSPGRPDAYRAGGPGPDAATALVERDGRTWQELDR
jgi:glucose-6-phosphate 1-dehydrogenase